MSWAKRNLYFVVSCIAAAVLLGLAGWYAYSSYSSNSAHEEELKAAYDQLAKIAAEPVGAGNDEVNNIDAAKAQTAQVKERVALMEKFFTPIPGIPNTNKIEDRVLSRAVRDTITQLRASALSHNVTIPVSNPEYAFSFTLQAGKTSYDPNSGEMLAKQLGEVKTICDTLFSSRVSAISSVQRERTADDANPANLGGMNDYCDSISLTNDSIVITPYQVTFDCFTPELGNVLSSFANQQHTIVVKTVNVQPADTTLTGYGDPAAMGRGDMTGGGMMPTFPGQPPPVATRSGGLPTAVDEKKLKVTLLLDFVKILPTQGR